MKRRNFLQLMAALAGLPFLPKAAKAVATVADPSHYHEIPPIGTLMAYAGAKVPEGWLPCDGRVISPNAYPKLFELLGPPGKVPYAGPVQTGPHYSEFDDRLEISMSPFEGTFFIIKAK